MKNMLFVLFSARLLCKPTRKGHPLHTQTSLAPRREDMYLPALATVPVAWFLAYVPHFMKFGVILSKQRRPWKAEGKQP